MPFPKYKEMDDTFLCYIYFHGSNNFSVRPSDMYEPLADFFKLTKQERMQRRHDGRSGTEWDNKVQWERQRLINHSKLDGNIDGIWRLTCSRDSVT